MDGSESGREHEHGKKFFKVLPATKTHKTASFFFGVVIFRSDRSKKKFPERTRSFFIKDMICSLSKNYIFAKTILYFCSKIQY